MLKGKTALITGASRGIGRTIALKLAENGANVAIVYNGNAQMADEVRAAAEKFGVKALCYRCDVSGFEDTKELVRSVINDFGGVDILVNNAGIVRDGLVLSMKESDFDEVIGTNLKGAFNLIKHLYSQFIKRRSGRIINISSISGIMGNAGQANYSAAKAGIIGMTKSLARELASRGITCNAIAPGFIETDMTSGLTDRLKEAVIEGIPMKRMGNANDIAEMAVFLASDKAGYITGEVIKIDGGLCM